MSQLSPRPGPFHFDLMLEQPIVGYPELIVAPVAVAVRDVRADDSVPMHPWVMHLNEPIVIRAQEVDRDRYLPLLVSLSRRRLIDLHVLEPRIVRAAMVEEVEVPLGCCKLESVFRKASRVLRKVCAVSLSGATWVSISLICENEHGACREAERWS
jgi:hypothetical protein